MYTNWLSPGASGARGTTNASDHLHVIVLRSRAKKQVITLVSSCPVWFPWPFDHTALCPKTLSSTLSSKVACEWHNHLTLKLGGWISTGNQLGPRDIQVCLVFLSFFSNQIHKAKSLKNINVIVTLSRPLKLQGLCGASEREHIPFIQASLRPQPRSVRGSLRN